MRDCARHSGYWLLLRAHLSLSLVPSFNLGHVSGDLQARIWHEAAYLSAFVPDSKNLYLSIFWRKIASSPMQCSAHKPFVSCSIFMPSLVFFTPRLLRLSLRPDRLSALQKFICCIPDQWNLILSSTLSCNFYTRDTLWKPRARAHTHTHVPHNLYSFHFLVAVVFFPDISAQDMVESLRSNILWGFPFARFSFRSTSFLPFILYEIVVLKGANNKKWSVLSIDNYCFKTSFFQL